MNKSYNMNIDTGEKTWLTPPHIIQALGPFDLDPCCPPTMPWRTATRMVCLQDDGLAVGMDFGRDKSETIICESRRGKLVARYDLPDDPHLRLYRYWFDEEFKKRLSELFAKRVKKTEAEIFAWIKSNPICYVNPCEAILDGICGVITPAIYPHGNVLA